VRGGPSGVTDLAGVAARRPAPAVPGV